MKVKSNNFSGFLKVALLSTLLLFSLPFFPYVSKYSSVHADNLNFFMLLSKNDILDDKPIGQERITGDIFGRLNGFFHPSLSIAEYYTDNVFNSRDKRDDFITLISTGIEASLPGTGRVKRYLVNVKYLLDSEIFSKYSSENTINQKLENLFQYNFKGGLSIKIAEKFVKSHDIRGTGTSTEIDMFISNRSAITLSYDISPKSMVKFDYSNFFISYDASRNNFRDHIRNSFSWYFFYKFKQKTAVFFEYEFVDIAYDKDDVLDSLEQLFYGGIQWDITAKSKGSFKAGFGDKNFTNSTTATGKDFILELKIDHAFTQKTSLNLTASRKTEETNILLTNHIINSAVKIGYRQKFVKKLTGILNFSYVNTNYEGSLPDTRERDDDMFGVDLAFQYELKKWLQTATGYILSNRNSNFSSFDYTSNKVFIRVTGSL